MSGSLIEKYQQFQNQGSGWQFDNVENFDINIDPFKLLSGSSYIPLSKVLGSKKVVVNVKNEKDNESRLVSSQVSRHKSAIFFVIDV